MFPNLHSRIAMLSEGTMTSEYLCSPEKRHVQCWVIVRHASYWLCMQFRSSNYDGPCLGHHRCSVCSCEKVLRNNERMSEVMQCTTGTAISYFPSDNRRLRWLLCCSECHWWMWGWFSIIIQDDLNDTSEFPVNNQHPHTSSFMTSRIIYVKSIVLLAFVKMNGDPCIQVLPFIRVSVCTTLIEIRAWHQWLEAKDLISVSLIP